VPPTIHPLPKDPYDRDVEQAKRLVAEVKVPKNWEPVILDGLALGSGKERMGDFVARDLALLGIKAKVVVVPNTTEFLDRMSKGKFDFAIGRWIADTSSVADFLASNLATDQQGTCPSCNNVYGYSEPEVDRLIADLRATRSNTALLRINEIFGRDVPYVPIAIGPETAAWNRRVTGFGPSPTPMLYLRNVGFGEKNAAKRGAAGAFAAGGR
jgi:ABC-type transport system substrate-binding protein